VGIDEEANAPVPQPPARPLPAAHLRTPEGAQLGRTRATSFVLDDPSDDENPYPFQRLPHRQYTSEKAQGPHLTEIHTDVPPYATTNSLSTVFGYPYGDDDSVHEHDSDGNDEGEWKGFSVPIPSPIPTPSGFIPHTLQSPELQSPEPESDLSGSSWDGDRRTRKRARDFEAKQRARSQAMYDEEQAVLVQLQQLPQRRSIRGRLRPPFLDNFKYSDDANATQTSPSPPPNEPTQPLIPHNHPQHLAAGARPDAPPSSPRASIPTQKKKGKMREDVMANDSTSSQDDDNMPEFPTKRGPTSKAALAEIVQFGKRVQDEARTLGKKYNKPITTIYDLAGLLIRPARKANMANMFRQYYSWKNDKPEESM
jgi:hypothetical protein